MRARSNAPAYKCSVDESSACFSVSVFRLGSNFFAGSSSRATTTSISMASRTEATLIRPAPSQQLHLTRSSMRSNWQERLKPPHPSHTAVQRSSPTMHFGPLRPVCTLQPS